jgi:hypothetical protein
VEPISSINLLGGTLVKVFMIQVTDYKWQLTHESGNILVDDVFMPGRFMAEEYARAFVSSYQNWTYEMVLLPERVQDVRRR